MHKIFLLSLISILIVNTLPAKERLPFEKQNLQKVSAFDPVLNRGRGYLSKGELQFATHNYGSFIEFEDYSSPSGLYKGYQYISDVSLIMGVPGRLPDGSFAPWALRPRYSVEDGFFTDTLVYWGSTVSESWFDRVTDKKQVDWESVEGHYGNLHSGDVLSGEIYGGLYTDTGDPYPLLASSDIPDSWPLRLNDETGEEVRTWPGDWAVDTDPGSPRYGQEVFGRHIGDQDIYMEFDDRLGARDEDRTQGYPMGIHVMVNAHSYGRSYAEDIAFFTVEIVNESYKGFPLDMDGDEEPDQIWIPRTYPDGTVTYEFQPMNFIPSKAELQDGSHYGFDYQEAYGGFYFDVDSYSRTENGSYLGRSNDDDMMAYDENFDMAYIWDWDDDSNGAENLAYSALKLLDTPKASRNLDLDGDGFDDVLKDQPLGMTDWHWFDWYARPGVLADENSGGSCPGGGYAGSSGCAGAVDKENIMYALMSGDSSYAGVAGATFNDWEWRDIQAGASNNLNPLYDLAYFHPDENGDLNPHFDSESGLREDFPDGLDCVFIMSAGPFDLNVGDTTYFSFAVIMGDPPNDTETLETPPDLAKNAEIAQIMYDLKYQGFSPPDAPTVSAVGDDRVVNLYWDSKAEYSTDIVTGISDFQGYKIYKSTDGGKTWGDPSRDLIYNNDQQAVGWKPIAQFDLDEDGENSAPYNYRKSYFGPDPVAPWFYSGSNSGLKHRYVDRDVINGVTYSYAVVAYDIGIDTLKDQSRTGLSALISDNNVKVQDSQTGEWGYKWEPLEYLENFKGNSPLLPQFVTVTPDAKPSNAPAAQSPQAAVWNEGTGYIEIIPGDVNALAQAQGIYKIVVDADSTYASGGEDNQAAFFNSTYSVYNMDNGDTLIGWVYRDDGSIDTAATQFEGRFPVEFTSGTVFGPTWDGFIMVSENFPAAILDTVEWIGKTPSSSPTWDISMNSTLGLYKYAADYDIIFGVPDSSVNNPPQIMPFTVINRRVNEVVSFRMSAPDPEGDGLPLLSEFPDFVNGAKINLREIEVPGYGLDREKTTWTLTFLWKPDSLTSNIHYEYPAVDTLRLTTNKPFRKGDEFVFDASSITQMEEVKQHHLEDIIVVPNPYIVTAGWETDINHKALHFTHLPDECVIRIFTLTGELVYTILHNDIFSGQEEWNLRSMNRQEVAPGLYIFVVETPNRESYTGKFAVIR